MSRNKLKTLTVPAAQTRAEAEAAVQRLGEIQRELTRAETMLNDGIAMLKAEAEAEVKPLQDELAQLTAKVQRFCEANRTDLTGGGKRKTVAFATGKVFWRARPPKVRVRGVAAVLAYLKAEMGGAFIRTKETVNRQALAADPDTARTIPGVSIGSDGEDFVIEPLNVELAAAS